MKKFIMALVAIVCLQGAQIQGALGMGWRVAGIARSGLDVLVGPGSRALSQWGIAGTLGATCYGLGNFYNAPEVQKGLGLLKPTTWYGKAWHGFKEFNENVGTVFTFASYCATVFSLVQAMNQAFSQEEQEVQPQLPPKKILKKKPSVELLSEPQQVATVAVPTVMPRAVAPRVKRRR